MISLVVRVSLIGFMLCLGCNKAEIQIKKFPSPYRDAFKGGNINYALIQAKNDTIARDTIYFDSIGNIVREVSFWSEKRYLYDSLGFFTHYFFESDISYNYLIQSDVFKNTLRQRWNLINKRTWNYSSDDIIVEEFYEVVYVLNSEGMVIKELNPVFHEDVTFEYDDAGKLIRKTHFDRNLGQAKKEVVFTYSDDKLVQINEVIIGYRELVYHYSGSLLDSIVTHENDTTFTEILTYYYH